MYARASYEAGYQPTPVLLGLLPSPLLPFAVSPLGGLGVLSREYSTVLVGRELVSNRECRKWRGLAG